MAEKTIRINARATTSPKPDHLKGLINSGLQLQMDRLRHYPEVIGGVHASYSSDEYDSQDVMTLSELMDAYSQGQAQSISVNGQNEIDKDKVMHLYFDVLLNRASLELSSKDEDYLRNIKSMFEELFPYEPYHQLDYALLQRGFEYTAQKSKPVLDYRKYASRATRTSLKASLGDKYGPFFERYCDTVAAYELNWSTLLNVQILNEGTGGDFDVLAIAEPTNDVIYIEAKTGNVATKDFKEFCNRFKLLQPSFAVIVLDHSTGVLETKLPLLQSAMKTAFNLEANPQATPLPSLARKWAYNLRGNIFMISGEDIPKTLKHCMRYFDGVTRHTLYTQEG